MNQYIFPPKILLGSGTLSQLPRHLEEKPPTRALLVTDRGIIAAGIAAQVEQVLREAGTEVVYFDQVKADPSLQEAAAGVELFLKYNCDLLVAVGGGSPIDCAKAIRLAAPRKGPQESPDQIPLVAIPTTAGTASEVTQYVVITDPDAQQKVAVSHRDCVPSLAVCDAQLTQGLPPQITANTGMDALTHALEAYLSTSSSALTDSLAARAVTDIVTYLPRAVSRGQEDMDAREKMMEAQLLAGLAFSSAGLGYVHATAHALGGTFQVPHGTANAMMLPHVLAFNLPAVTGKLAGLLTLLRGNRPALDEGTAAKVMGSIIWNLAQQVGTPSSLQEVGVTGESIPKLAQMAFQDPVGENNPRRAEVRDLEAVFQAALAGENPFQN